jgi:hypothetical protein
MATSIMKKGVVNKTPMTNVDFPQIMENNNTIVAPLRAMNNTIDIKDPRTFNPITNKALDPNVDSVGGKYSIDRVTNIIKAAKRYGINPLDLLAVDLQESGLGSSKREGNENVGHFNLRDHELTIPSKLSEDEAVDNVYDKFARAYATKMQYADKLGITDPATRLQTYNGLGKITGNTEKSYHGFTMKKIYGVPIPSEGIDMKKNPLYGKRVMDLRDNVLAKNPNLALYINHVTE